MNGVVLEAQASLGPEASAADAVIVGSGIKTLEVVADTALMESLGLDPSRQLIGAPCSGTLVLAKLGLLDGVPACADLITKTWVEGAEIAVLNQPFVAKGNVATAGGCLAAQYLSAWLIARLVGIEAARNALHFDSRRSARRTSTSREPCRTLLRFLGESAAAVGA